MFGFILYSDDAPSYLHHDEENEKIDDDDDVLNENNFDLMKFHHQQTN